MKNQKYLRSVVETTSRSSDFGGLELLEPYMSTVSYPTSVYCYNTFDILADGMDQSFRNVVSKEEPLKTNCSMRLGLFENDYVDGVKPAKHKITRSKDVMDRNLASMMNLYATPLHGIMMTPEGLC